MARATPRGGRVTPDVSVIVAARNAAETLAPCLTSLAAQTCTAHEVIVVDDGSTDGTSEVASRHGVAVVRTSGVGASAARNRGLELATGRIVAFTDADCTVVPGWLASLVDVIDRTQATGAGGPQRNVFPGDASGGAAFDAFFRLASVVSDYARSGREVREVTHNASCNSAYTKQSIVDVGGFTEGMWPGEDVDLDLRLRARGATLMFVPDALVFHHRPGTVTWFRRMMRRYGAAERALVQRHGRARRIDYVPAALLTAAALHLLYVVPACRLWLLIADATIAMTAAVTVMVVVPARHWLSVIVFAVTAVWEWHVGWWRGPEVAR